MGLQRTCRGPGQAQGEGPHLPHRTLQAQGQATLTGGWRVQGARAGLEVRQEGRLDLLAGGHVGDAAAGGHGWRGAPWQWGAGVARDGTGGLWGRAHSQGRWRGRAVSEHTLGRQAAVRRGSPSLPPGRLEPTAHSGGAVAEGSPQLAVAPGTPGLDPRRRLGRGAEHTSARAFVFSFTCFCAFKAIYREHTLISVLKITTEHAAPRWSGSRGATTRRHSQMVPLELGRLPELPCTPQDTGRCLATRSLSTRGPSPAKCLKAAVSQCLTGAAAGLVEVALPCSAVPGGQRWTGAAGDQGKRRGRGAGQGQVRTALLAGTAAPDTPAKGRQQMSREGQCREGQLQGRAAGPTPGATGSPAGTPASAWPGMALGQGVDAHLTGVAPLEPLSGQRRGLHGAREPMLGQALPRVQGRHAGRPGMVHAHRAHARGAQQASHAGRAHAAGPAGAPVL